MQQPWLAAERYEVGAVVGRGGYGMVCRGLDRKTGLPVALKMLSPAAGKDPDLVERMLREQQALVALSGTCAVTAIDLCRLDSGAPCLVMEWLEGRDLEQQLSEWEAAKELGSEAQLLQVMEPLAKTLECAHQLGIVHRDIKPANIFLARNAAAGESVRLLDFGLSRMRSAAPLTAAGIVMGSPSYIAPETWSGNSVALDGRADLFALAVIAFRWLTGALPFDAPDLLAKMAAVTSGPRPKVTALRPELPAAVDAWMSRALAVERADRFQTGSDFYDALAAALQGKLWSDASADISGVRTVTSPASPERKSALSTAWSRASSLLRRFTNPRERASEITPAPAVAPARAAPPPVATEAVDDPPASEGKSLWLDSTELEELTSSPDAATDPPPTPASPIAAEPVAEPEPAATVKAKGKASSKPKGNRAKGKSKSGGGGKSRAARKARSQKRKA